MLYSWNGSSAVKLVEDEVPFIFTQNDSRNFPRVLPIASQNGKYYLVWMSNGDLAGNNKAYSMERIETVVNGQGILIFFVPIKRETLTSTNGTPIYNMRSN